MGFTIETDWSGLAGVHALSARSPIVSGYRSSDRDYALAGLTLDQRLVRCTRHPNVVSRYRPDAWTMDTGPGAGLANWEYFFGGWIRTRESFSGTFNVTAWAEDCESTGGVYLAVGSDDVTLVNTTSGTLEEITSTISGSPGASSYLVTVAFASTANMTEGKLYGFRIECDEQSSDA